MGSDVTLRISVVMCTYNGARYLREQLDTILGQTYPVYEVIVQDDGSRDETFPILEEYAKKYPVIKIYHNESGLHGINGNFFSAMARAEGDYIAISDQDDIWEKDKLRLQAEAIGDHLLCSAFSVPFSTTGYPVKIDNRIPNTHLLRNNYVCELPGHSMLFRRELLQYIWGGEEWPLYYDCQLMNAAAAAESVVFLPRQLVHFRRHADAATAALPINNHLLSKGAWEYIKLSLLHHSALQRQVRRRFEVMLPFMEKLPFDTRSRRDAVYMGKLQLGHGPVVFVKKVLFFLRHSRHLFHAEVPNPVIRTLRAAFFVYSCGYYYRGQI